MGRSCWCHAGGWCHEGLVAENFVSKLLVECEGEGRACLWRPCGRRRCSRQMFVKMNGNVKELVKNVGYASHAVPDNYACAKKGKERSTLRTTQRRSCLLG